MEAKEIKIHIVEMLKRNGPSLPVHVTRIVQLDMLFTGAFLSELYNEKIVKISNMKVGSSPLYFLPGQEKQLEKYMGYLQDKEKEACFLLKREGLLEDSKQPPAIRVALRNLKDFAIPIKSGKEIIWKYLTYEEVALKPEHEIDLANAVTIKSSVEMKGIDTEIEKKKAELETLKKELEIQRSAKERYSEAEQIVELEKKKLVRKLKTIKKAVIDETFLNEVKTFLAKKEVVFLEAEQFDKKQVTAKIRIKGEEVFLIALNKRKLADEDLTKAHKKAANLGLRYVVLSKGEISKKTKELIEAYKNLIEAGKMEN